MEEIWDAPPPFLNQSGIYLHDLVSDLEAGHFGGATFRHSGHINALGGKKDALHKDTTMEVPHWTCT